MNGSKVGLICLLTLTLLLPSVALAADAKFHWRLAGVTADGTPMDNALDYFSARVYQATEGRLKIDVYPAMQLGDPVQIYRAIQRGDIQLGICVAYPFINKRFNLPHLPYLVDNYAAADKLIWGDSWLSREMKKVYSDTGIISLAPIENGFRGLSNRKRPIKSPSDVKGLKIRHPGFPTYVAFYNAMKASAVKVPYAELYTSLQKGVIDAQDNGPINTYTMAFYEVQPYYTWMKHAICYITLGINKKLFGSLPDDIKNILIKLGKETTKIANDGQRGQYELCIQEMATGGTKIIKELSPEQKNKFKEIGFSVWPTFQDDIGKELMEKAYKEVGRKP